MFNELFKDEQQRCATIYERLEARAKKDEWERTAVQEAVDTGNPLRILISAMLSARTREEATRKATNNLFNLAETAAEILLLDDAQIMQAIRMTTYADAKAPYVRGICEKIIKDHEGKVPQTLESLSDLPGVGWKTAVLTQWLAFGIAEEICVDVHVARIGLRLGLVNPKTKQPEKVSRELMQRVPKHLWGPWNPLMVIFGREICLFDKPRCLICPLNDICPKVGVVDPSLA
jgi:endonuclease III